MIKPRHVVHENGWDILVLIGGTTDENLAAAINDSYDILYLSAGDWLDLEPFREITYKVQKLWVKTYGKCNLSALEIFSKINWLKLDDIEGLDKNDRLNFSKFQSLEECDISWKKYYGTSIYNLSQLIKMTLRFYDEPDLTSVSNLSKLTHLTLMAGKLKSINGINNLKSLTSLNLHSLRQLGDIEMLTELSQSLKHLSIGGCKKAINVTPIKDLINIEHIFMGDGLVIESFHLFEKMLNIKYFGVRCKIESYNMEILFNLPKLQKIELIAVEGFNYQEQDLFLLANKYNKNINLFISEKGKNKNIVIIFY